MFFLKFFLKITVVLQLCRLKDHIEKRNNNPILIFPEGELISRVLWLVVCSVSSSSGGNTLGNLQC